MKNELGVGVGKMDIIVSITCVILISFYILSLGSFVEPIIHPLIDRVTYSTPFTDVYFINEHYDSVVILASTLALTAYSVRTKIKNILIGLYLPAIFLECLFPANQYSQILMLLSAPIIGIIVAYSRIANKIMFNHKLKPIIAYLALLLICLNILALMILTIETFNPSLVLPSVNYFYYYYLLLSTLSPLLLILIIFYIPLNLVIGFLRRRSTNGVIYDEKTVTSNNGQITTPQKILLLSLVILFALFLTAIPLIHSNGSPIGDDSKDYSNFMSKMVEKVNPLEAIWQALAVQSSGDRALSLIFFYSIFSTINLPPTFESMEFLPFFLSPPLIITIYILTSRITNNNKTAILAAFLTCTSTHFVIGIYGGLYANWLALVFGFLALSILTQVNKKPTRLAWMCFSLIFVALVLSHAPTWAIFLIVTVTYMIILAIYDKEVNRRIVGKFLLAIAPSIIIDLIRVFFLKSSGMLQDITFAQTQGSGLQNIYSIWQNLDMTSHIYLAGQIGNPIILIILIYFLYSPRLSKTIPIWMIVFITLAIPLMFIGVQEIQTRFLYEIPFQIPVAMAIIAIKNKYGYLLATASILSLAVITIRTLSNFTFLEDSQL